jgi:hypothetical protein
MWFIVGQSWGDENSIRVFIHEGSTYLMNTVCIFYKTIVSFNCHFLVVCWLSHLVERRKTHHQVLAESKSRKSETIFAVIGRYRCNFCEMNAFRWLSDALI